MANPYVGEIRLFGGNFAPVGWAFCDGTILSIADNTTLFQLIGTTYGGDGATTFALPDLRSRVPLHIGPGFVLGQSQGTENVVLTVNQLPAHTHIPQANSGSGTQTSPAGAVWAAAGNFPFSSTAPGTPMAPAAVAPAGGGQPHNNMLPFLAVNFIISLFGIFPSQT